MPQLRFDGPCALPGFFEGPARMQPRVDHHVRSHLQQDRPVKQPGLQRVQFGGLQNVVEGV